MTPSAKQAHAARMLAHLETTMTEAHTQGPWTIDRDAEKRGALVITANDGHCMIAEVNDAVFVCAENARLIAAAPDYDAAARMLLAGLPDETFQYRETLTKSEVEHLNAAIVMFKAARAKAEGLT